MAMSREKRCLVSFLNGKIDGVREESLDWDRLLKIADHSRVTPLLYQTACPHLRGGSGYEKIADRLKASYLFCRMKNEILLGEFRAIAKTFNGNNIPVMPLKGIYLILTSFDDSPGIRIMTDIDILIRKEDHAKADESIRSLSYATRQYCGNENTIMYFKEAEGGLGPLQVHIHWHISNTSEPFMARHRDTIKIDKIWRDARPLSGDGNRIITMSREHGLVALSEHGLRHGFARMDLIYDIHRHISHYGDIIDWKKVSETANRWNLGFPVHFGLRAAKIMFGTKFSDDILELFKPFNKAGFAEKMLMQSIMDNDFPSESSCALFYLAMTKGLQDKLSFAASLASYALKKRFSNRREYASDNMPG